MSQQILPFSLGLILFSFLLTCLLMVPFINLLYKLKLTRKKEAPKKGKIPLFDKLHDKKAGTPLGGGILIVVIVTLLFYLLFPFASHMGVYISSCFDLRTELFVIFFTFVSFGLLGFTDDLIKIFGRPKKGFAGFFRGLTGRQKFIVQFFLAGIISWILYTKLGIKILHIPLFDFTFDLNIFYVPFASFVIVSFSNAFNITDGLDGLATGLLLICLLVFAILAASSLDTPLILMISLWLGSLIAFLYFNVWPARIFLGDAGALSFGAMLAVIGLLTGSIIALVVVGGIFVVEIASSAIQIISLRLFKKKVFILAPIHNSFLARNWEEPKIVVRAWLAGIILAIFALWLSTI